MSSRPKIMEDSWPERQQLVQELLQGQASTINLAHLLVSEPNGEDSNNILESLSAEQDDLLEKVLESFTSAISILMHQQEHDHDGDGTSRIGSSNCIKTEENSEESCRNAISTNKDGRGRYKRRKNSETWSQITSALIDDGHAWRKYGQKKILNAGFPRSYFRCTHKYDQGCQATKQVQKISDSPSMYKTVYENRHTCNGTVLQHLPQLLLDSDPKEDEGTSPVLLCFNASEVHTNVPKPKKLCTNKYYPVPSSWTLYDSAKQGASSSSYRSKSSSPFEYLNLPDPLILSSTLDTDYGGAMSSLNGSEVDNMFPGLPFNFDAVW